MHCVLNSFAFGALTTDIKMRFVIMNIRSLSRFSIFPNDSFYYIMYVVVSWLGQVCSLARTQPATPLRDHHLIIPCLVHNTQVKDCIWHAKKVEVEIYLNPKPKPQPNWKFLDENETHIHTRFMVLFYFSSFNNRLPASFYLYLFLPVYSV